MLVGDDDGFDCYRHLVFIFDGDLCLAVRTQIMEGAILAHLGQLFCQLVCQRDRHRHQLWSIVAGKTEHHALVAGAVVLLGAVGIFCLQTFVYAQRDVAGLLVDGGDDAAGIAVKAKFCAVIADVTDDLTGNLRDVHIAGGADFSHYHDHAGGNGGFTGYTSVWVLLQNRVEHCVGNLVTDFIGMSFGNRFGCK